MNVRLLVIGLVGVVVIVGVAMFALNEMKKYDLEQAEKARIEEARKAEAEAARIAEKEGRTITASLTGQPGNADAGRQVVVNRKLGNCLACHAITELSDQQFHGEIGPPLDGVADRYSAAELRALVVDAKKINPDTIMPAFHRSEGLNRVAKSFVGKTILSAQQVEDVVAYLQTLKEES